MAVVAALAIAGTTLPAFAGHVVSPILTESSPSVWWEKNRETVLKDVTPDAESVAFTNDGQTVIPETVECLHVPAAAAELVEDELAWGMAGLLLRDVPGGKDSDLAGRMQTFLLAAADLKVHTALKLAEFFKDNDGELESEYAELCQFLAEPQGEQLLAALRSTPPEADETLSKYMRRIKRDVDNTGRSMVRKGLSGLEDVAQRMAAIATVYTERLSTLSRQFTSVTLPTTDAEMQDVLYLVTKALGEWEPVYVGSETMELVRIKVEANVARYITDRRKAGGYPRTPWPGFMESLTDKLSDSERVEANLLARRALVDLAKYRVAHDESYHKAVGELRALATFLTLIAKRNEPVRQAVRTNPRTSTYGSGDQLKRTVIDCVMVMRFVTEDNDDILAHYYNNTAITPQTKNSRIKYSCNESVAVVEANHVLQELARVKPTVVVPILERTLADERKRAENAGKMTRDDLVFESNWSTKYTEFAWKTPEEFHTRMQNTLDIATGGDLHRKSGTVARLTALPAPMKDGVVITD